MNLIQQSIFLLFLMAGLLCLSAFFSGAETALFSLSSDAARRLRKNRPVGLLLDILHHEPSELLSSILFGNLIVNILFFCTGAAAAGRLGSVRGEWFEALGGVVILVLVILFGEIIPKAVGINHSARVLRLTASPLRIWFRCTRSIGVLARRVFRLKSSIPSEGLTQGELKELLDAVHHESGFGDQEKEILEDIVNLSSVRVREIMVPRVKVMRKSLQASPADVLEEARKNEFSHVLMYRENDDNPAGYIQVRDLYFLQPFSGDLESLLHPLVFVPETKRVDRLLQEFMRENWKLAAVVDEYGGLSGVVTIEDLFEEIVGDLEPEAADEIIQLDDRTYRLRGQLPIRAWRELFIGFLPGQDVDAMAFDTLGGLVVSLLGRMPRDGDSVTVRNLRITVEAVRRHRIETVLLHLNDSEADQ